MIYKSNKSIDEIRNEAVDFYLTKGDYAKLETEIEKIEEFKAANPKEYDALIGKVQNFIRDPELLARGDNKAVCKMLLQIMALTILNAPVCNLDDFIKNTTSKILSRGKIVAPCPMSKHYLATMCYLIDASYFPTFTEIQKVNSVASYGFGDGVIVACMNHGLFAKEVTDLTIFNGHRRYPYPYCDSLLQKAIECNPELCKGITLSSPAILIKNALIANFDHSDLDERIYFGIITNPDSKYRCYDYTLILQRIAVFTTSEKIIKRIFSDAQRTIPYAVKLLQYAAKNKSVDVSKLLEEYYDLGSMAANDEYAMYFSIACIKAGYNVKEVFDNYYDYWSKKRSEKRRKSILIEIFKAAADNGFYDKRMVALKSAAVNLILAKNGKFIPELLEDKSKSVRFAAQEYVIQNFKNEIDYLVDFEVNEDIYAVVDGKVSYYITGIINSVSTLTTNDGTHKVSYVTDNFTISVEKSPRTAYETILVHYYGDDSETIKEVLGLYHSNTEIDSSISEAI